MYQQLIYLSLLGVTFSQPNYEFPPWFMFGVATSAYQVEGAWNVSDKSPSIQDIFMHTHKPWNGDVTADMYHVYKKDVFNMANILGLNHFRFSISWTRLLPNGFANKISEAGRRYYSDLIDELLRNGIEPMVTIYHWDLPQRLQDYGGWMNPEISDWFADYARVVFTLFGDRVRLWLTVNEPTLICDLFYTTGEYAPGIRDPDIAPYVCGKNVIMAHAKAYRIYDQEFKPKYHGRVSLANVITWLEPDSPADKDITDIASQYGNLRLTDPIFSAFGGWPPVIEDIIAEKSWREGYANSRLPTFSPEEIDLVKGTYDFFGINFYKTYAIRRLREGESPGPWPRVGSADMGVKVVHRPEWETPMGVPTGLRKALNYIRQNYGDIDIFITETGYGDPADNLLDDNKILYLKLYLEQVLLAIHEDNIKVTGFTFWSLLDTFEWDFGYRYKYGLFSVNFTCPERTRTPRKSAFYYSDVIRYRSLSLSWP